MLDPGFFRLKLLERVLQGNPSIFQCVRQLIDFPDRGLNGNRGIQIPLAEFSG
jgi:hypothetical protein